MLQGFPFNITYVIDKGSIPVFHLTFDGVVFAAPYNNVTLSGTTTTLRSLPVGIHNVIVTAFNPLGTVTLVVNFIIESPIINANVSCPPSSVVRLDIY